MHQCGTYNHMPQCGIDNYMHHLDATPHFDVMLLQIKKKNVATFL